MKQPLSLPLVDIILLFCVITLVACNPVTEEQDYVETFILSKTDNNVEPLLTDKPKQSQLNIQLQQQTYHVKNGIKNPFKVIQFFPVEKNSVPIKQPAKKPPCRYQMDCPAPNKSSKHLLTNYHLNTLRFVGTIGNQSFIALIKTPEGNIVQARVGDMLGQNDGTITNINESAITLHELFYQSDTWDTKETVLSLNP